jgi:hypothetical protein
LRIGAAGDAYIVEISQGEAHLGGVKEVAR